MVTLTLCQNQPSTHLSTPLLSSKPTLRGGGTEWWFDAGEKTMNTVLEKRVHFGVIIRFR